MLTATTLLHRRSPSTSIQEKAAMKKRRRKAVMMKHSTCREKKWRAASGGVCWSSWVGALRRQSHLQITLQNVQKCILTSTSIRKSTWNCKTWIAQPLQLTFISSCDHLEPQKRELIASFPAVLGLSLQVSSQSSWSSPAMQKRTQKGTELYVAVLQLLIIPEDFFCHKQTELSE